MTAPVLLLPLVEARLKTITDVRDVQGAIDLSAVQDKPIPLSPLLFVVPLTDDPGVNERTTSGQSKPLQKVIHRIALVVAIKNMADPYGAQGNSELELIKLRVREALHGWIPAPGYASFELGRGGLIAMRDYTIYWQMEFKTHFYYEGLGNV
ncbi:MAG: hypothetical protein JKX92_12200 [Porticoccaceae bacterium]|nr:hypothetical protein [Porticoccaceae bacterium]